MAAYFIIDMEDQERFEMYQKVVPTTVTQYGGRYLVRGGQLEVLEGHWHPSRLVVLKFPSMAAAKRWYESEEYQKIKPLPRLQTRSDMVLVEGV